MRLMTIAAGTAVVLGLAVAPLDAAQKGAKGPSAKTSGPKAPKTPKATAAPKPAKAPKAATVKTAKAPKASKAPTKAAATRTVAASPTTTTSPTTTAPTTTTSTTPTTIDFTQGAVAERLARNTNLRAKLESRLQAAGYDGTVYQAAYGFKNQGQFIAATNVSSNLGIPFEQLKLQMTGLSIDADGVVVKTDQPTRSLGQAIQTVNPTVDATAAELTAIQQADAEIAATSAGSQ